LLLVFCQFVEAQRAPPLLAQLARICRRIRILRCPDLP
jgi:hypothetical protein